MKGTPMKAPLALAVLLGLSACASMGEPPPARHVTAASPEVRVAQNRLHKLGYYNGPIDGIWGPDTAGAVDRFQRFRGIPETGRLDETTRISLRETMPANPLQPSVIQSVQERLQTVGFYSGPHDGIWGPETQSALRAFQRSRSLDANGELTPATASALGLNPNDLRESAEMRSAGGYRSDRDR